MSVSRPELRESQRGLELHYKLHALPCLLPSSVWQGGALLNIRDALGIGDWAAEAIVAAAKFGAVVRL